MDGMRWRDEAVVVGALDDNLTASDSKGQIT